MKVLPVVHYLNDAQSLAQGVLALEEGADGLFLISHSRDDNQLGNIAVQLKSKFPSKLIGLNYLHKGPTYCLKEVIEYGLDMMWGDYCGVSSTKTDLSIVDPLKSVLQLQPSTKIFCSVAFKYQAPDRNPALAAAAAELLGFIPTTSGDATGSAPSITKIEQMSQACSQLAVASGMTPDNIKEFKPHLAYCLVATGISKDEYTFDVPKLKQFLINAHS